MMTLFDAADGINRESVGRKDVLPGEFTDGVRVFPLEGIREVDGTVTHGEIQLVLSFDLVEVEAQGFKQEIRKRGDPVILALAIAYDDLAIGEVQVLDP